MMSIPNNNHKLAVDMANRVETALAKRVGDQSEVLGSPQQQSPQLKTQFEINDLADTDRILLTSKSIQNDIEEFSGTIIVTRGRFLTPKEKNQASSERSLHLLIKGPKKQNLDLAIQKIQSLIQRDKDMSKHPNLTSGPLINGAGIEKVLIGLDHAPPAFDLRNKILGVNGANLHYIMNETGAVVTMRGRGSGFIEANGQESVEPLHLCVEHAKNEVLQNGRQLAFNLIETIQNEYSATYGSNHVASSNVNHQNTTVHIQPPIIQQSLQTNNGQMQQLNPTQYQTVQVAAQPNMMPLQDNSQMVQTSVSNVQMPLFTQHGVPQIMAVPSPVLGNHQQHQSAQNPQGPTHIASMAQPQASIIPQIQAQVVNPQQQQIPLSITPVSYSTIQQHQIHQQQQQQQTKSLENVQHTPSVTHTTPTSLANGVIPHTQAFMTQATLPIQYIQTSNGQIIAYQPQVQSNAFQMTQTPNVSQVTQLSQPTNTGLIGTTYILGSQVAQYQQPASQPGQVMIVQYQQPTPEIQQPTLQTIHLQQTQSGQFIPTNIPNGQLIVQQTPGQPAQIQMMMPQLNQFQNIQPQIIQNLPGLLQTQTNHAQTQQLLIQQQSKTFAQQAPTQNGNQIMSIPISHQILQTQGNGIVTMALPQHQQQQQQQQQQPPKPHHQIIQTQISDKQQVIYKQEETSHQPIMIQQGQQQSVQYYHQSNQFQYQPVKRSYEMIVSEGGGLSGTKIIRTGPSPITGNNENIDENPVRHITVNGIVQTSSNGRRTPQSNFQQQSTLNASNISGEMRSKDCSNINLKGRGFEPDQRSNTPISESNRSPSVTYTVVPDSMRNQTFTPTQTAEIQQHQPSQGTITYQSQQQIPSYWIQQSSSPQENIAGTPPPKEGTLHYVD